MRAATKTRTRTSKSRSKANIGKALPDPIQIKINVTRRRLQRASAVLSCLAVAADEGTEFDVSDVAIAVRDIVARAVDTLDPTNLTGGLRQSSQ
jgi:hypothetical protein